MTEKTKHAPTMGKYNALPENSVIDAANPPKESEPVSPIKTYAGETLNKRYATKAPIKANESIGNPVVSSCKRIKTPKTPKYGALTPAASPSKPSVKFTALTVAINTKIAKGTIHVPTSHDLLRKGKWSTVKPSFIQYTPAKTAIEN